MADPIDIHAGLRIKARRKQLGLSQTDLAEALGLTFQQVQKYERGVNRVSFSKGWIIAKALGVPLAYFFEGLPDQPSVSDGPDTLTALACAPGGLALATAFLGMPAGPRAALINLAESMAPEARHG